MKKSLLISAALVAASSAFAAKFSLQRADASAFGGGLQAPAAAAAAATRADDTFEFSYSDELYSLTKLNGVKGGTTRVYLLFQLSADDIKGLAGDKVTGFTVYSSSNQNMNSNSIKNGRFFYSLDLSKEDYSQDFTMSGTPFEANSVAIDEPYTIKGDEGELYFGYSIVVPKNDDMYYVPYDGKTTSYPGAGIFSASDTDDFPQEFYSFASDLGALSMSITLEGENFPNYVSFSSAPNAFYLPLGKESSSNVTLTATVDEPIKSVDIQYTFAGGEINSHHVLDQPVVGASRSFTVPVYFPAFNEKIKENVKFTVTKFNDTPNVCDGASIEVPVAVLSEVPVHQTLLEEYTGIGCGWCTRGYAALEYIKKNEPDFVVAAYHSSMFGTDAMVTVSTFPVSVSGLPFMSIDRFYEGDPYYGTQKYGGKIPIVEEVKALNSVVTPWGIEVAHNWIDDDTLEAVATVWNVAGYENGSYKIAYVLVADGLTGTTSSWRQSNYYYNQASSEDYVEELNQFCRGGVNGKSKVSGLVYNDVVISSTGIYGVDGSVPASLEAEVKASHSLTFDLSTIKSTLLPDKNKLRVIAMVLDRNGRVLNCAKNEVNDYEGAAVDGIFDENAPVEYYNLNGMRVAEPSNGIFIRRQGSKTEKVVIK